MAEQTEKNLPSKALTSPILCGLGAAIVVAIVSWGYVTYQRNAHDEQVEAVAFRNQVWQDINQSNVAMVKTRLGSELRRQYVLDKPPTVEDSEIINSDRKWIGQSQPENGIVDRNGSLTREAIDRLQQAKDNPGAWTPEPDPQLDLSTATITLGWPFGPILWTTFSAVVYVTLGRRYRYVKPGYRDESFDRGHWLGITRAKGAWPQRALVAILYAPILLLVTAFVGIRGTFLFVWSVPSQLREWHAIRTNPYRVEIRKARRALDVLREENADEALIASAEEQVALWMTRHEHETKEASDMSAVERRSARIEAARETLLRLDSSAETDGIKPNPKRAPQPTRASNGS